MLKNKGMTLIETLLAFSIFISCVTIVITCYSSALKHHQKRNQEYQEYIQSQSIKELGLWNSNDLSESIQAVLH